ncbi:MAG: Ryanodine receptor Ryr [Gammaproteobacteria bacterium]|jgi:hypothetical protein|nr:Ryanodine receptor Ryr [Gammaproteobacteria bacterium]
MDRRARRRVLLVGEGRIADACAAFLGAGPGWLRRRPEAGVGPSDLAAADLVIVAMGDRSEAWLASLWPQLETSVQCRHPLRVVLVDDSAPQRPAATDQDALAPLLPKMRLERVSIPQRAARQLLVRWPLHWGADPCFGQPVHLLILGDDAFAEALLVQALRIGQYGEQRLRVTVLARASERFRHAFDAAFPQAGEIADIDFGSLEDPPLQSAPPVTMAVICAEPPESALALTDSIKARLALVHQAPPLLIDVGEVEPAGELADWDAQLVPFSRLALALDRAALLGGRGDELAQVIHEHYRDTTAAQGRDPSNEAAGRPWDVLAASYRDANRHQADHIWAKLATTDCRAVPEERVESFAFAPVEVERLAMIEHARWAADRWLDGWSYAPERDNSRKHHPQLIPYEALSGPMKDLDRFAVRLVPTLLARSGLGILRILLVGVAPSRANPERSVERLIRRALARLVARYPDRALIIAASPADPFTRCLVRLAIDEFGAGFFLLIDRPLSRLLEYGDPGDRGVRVQTLALMGRAERRIQLIQPGALQRWLDQRAEILVELGQHDPTTSVGERKRLRIDPADGLDWNFEY